MVKLVFNAGTLFAILSYWFYWRHWRQEKKDKEKIKE